MFQGRPAIVHTFLAACMVYGLSGCARPELPQSDSEAYQQVVTAFFSSVASIQSGEDAGAETNLQRVVDLAPGEPAAWYNLGLLALRQNNFELGRERLNKALALAPDESMVHRLIGVMELSIGNVETGVESLRRAIDLDSTDVKAWYALAQQLGNSGEPAQVQEALRIFETLTALLPENLAVLVEKARLSAQYNDVGLLPSAVNELDALAGNWDEEIREPLEALKIAVQEQNAAQAQVQAGFLRNMLLSTFSYRRDLLQVQTPTEELGDLLDRFVRLPSPTPMPSPPDTSLRYVQSDISGSSEEGSWVHASLMDGEGNPDLLYADTHFVQINDQRFDHEAQGPGNFGVALLDYNYDFYVDVVHANSSGLLILEQDSLGRFTQKEASAMVEEPWAKVPYSNAWVADVDSEGDLDLILSSREHGTVVLRNNGDSRFSRVNLFSDVQNLVDVVWADLDGDGDPDPVLLNEDGEVYVYSNERMGQFVRRAIPPVLGVVQSMAIGDLNSDGLMDVVCVNATGSLFYFSDWPGEGWLIEEVDRWDVSGVMPPGSEVFIQDLDNNGGVDLLLSTERESRIWLSRNVNEYNRLDEYATGEVTSIADMNGDGLLDLLGVSAEGTPSMWQGNAEQTYHWQVVRPRAGQALGDQRINSFTLGGEIEIRAGLLYQKQPIQAPSVHFGLGDRQQTDVARLIWPNGDIQSEFDLEADQSILTPQRLKGSCPWLFTYDGNSMQFVTDFIWRSPLGLRINAQETAGIMTTEDWVKIRGDQLAPRDGLYDVRITAELWETHFFDHVALIAVDHPLDTDIFVDERFAFPPPELRVHHTSKMRPFKRVLTDAGLDVSETVLNRDGNYLDFFGRGRYQGITREHYIEIELGDHLLEVDAPVLIGVGWVRPTDSSINVAISQGEQYAPQGLVLDIPDGKGGWMVGLDHIGFPAGKTKTILVDLSDLLQEHSIQKVRLRTNLEIYWDQMGWVDRRSDDEVVVHSVALASADLRYRGFSVVHTANRSSPETPAYDQIAGTMPRWRDLEGYYTRYGEVNELLDEVDDRYVIMNAGDELRFAFQVLPPPAEGMARDFVLMGDGWVKDGDYNTAFSKTVLPLPSHNDAAYNTPPTSLWEDPVYKAHARDWTMYHTRYISPERFASALVTRE